MISSRSRIICAVEIGTSRCVAVIGEVTEQQRSLNIIGYGRVATRGVTKGVINDLKAAGDATHEAVLRAERAAGGVKSDGVFLAVTGAHIGGYANQGTVNVSGNNSVVSREDIATVVQLAKQKRPPPDHSVIHYMRGQFRVDGKPVASPELLRGRVLSVGYWIAHGRTDTLSNAIRIVNGFNLRVHDVILSSLASAVMVTGPEERQNGVLVVDIGAGTTDYALYRDGFVQRTGVIAVGGNHVTNDLSLALRLSQADAEVLKLRHGRAETECKDRAQRVLARGDRSVGDREVSLQSVEKVVSVRVEELFEVLRKRLGEDLVPGAVNAGVVLTGGSSKLPRITETASRVLGLPARLGENPDWVAPDLRGPEFSTALGVLHYGLLYPGEQGARRGQPGLIDRVMKVLRLA